MVVISLAQVVFLCACADQYLAEYVRWTLCRSSEFFLCTSVHSPVLCPANSSYFGLSGLSALSLQFRESPVHCLGSPSLHCGLETLNAVNWGNHSVHLVCFPSLRNHSPSFPEAQCLRKLFLVNLVHFFVISDGKVILVPIWEDMLRVTSIFMASTTPSLELQFPKMGKTEGGVGLVVVEVVGKSRWVWEAHWTLGDVREEVGYVSLESGERSG